MANGTAITLAEELPDDLARVAVKGLGAAERFLDEPVKGKKLDQEVFGRRLAQAKVGCSMVGGAIRFLAVLNNREAIALAKRRALPASDNQ